MSATIIVYIPKKVVIFLQKKRGCRYFFFSFVVSMLVFSAILLPTAIILTTPNSAADMAGVASDERLSDAMQNELTKTSTNYLLYIDTDNNYSDTFLLLTFHSHTNKLYLHIIPSKFSVSNSEDVTDLSLIHGQGGSLAVAHELSKIFEVEISRFSYFELDGFKYVLNSLGSIRYYTDTPIKVSSPYTGTAKYVLEAGNHFIDSDTFTELLYNSDGDSNVLYQRKLNLFSALFSQKFENILSDDNLFSVFTENSTGNVNALDYQRIKSTLLPILEQSQNSELSIEIPSYQFDITSDAVIISDDIFSNMKSILNLSS